jgi:hypothetical protein
MGNVEGCTEIWLKSSDRVKSYPIANVTVDNNTGIFEVYDDTDSYEVARKIEESEVVFL